MSLFDVIRYQPIPSEITQEYLDSLPPQVYLRYRVWGRKRFQQPTQETIHEAIIRLLKEHKVYHYGD